MTTLTKYWQIIAFIISLAVWWATTGARLNALEQQTAQNTTKIEQATAASQAIDIRLSRIETDVQWIRLSLERQK